MAKTPLITAERQTIVYDVRIVRANPGAWYKDENPEKVISCILDTMDKPFGGSEIMFRVLGCYNPVRHLRPDHCIVVGQHDADKTEAYQHYGTKHNGNGHKAG